MGTLSLFLVLWVATLAAEIPAASNSNWPSFRGHHASGTSPGHNLPDRWSGESGHNVRWKTPIPGLGHSSPIVWGDRVFVTTAVSSDERASFKHGLFGGRTASDDRSEHRFVVYALDLQTGRVLWEQTLYRGTPQEKRHIKASYANQTPATDGRVIAAFFGSEGVFGLDLDGKLLWRREMGFLDVGAYDAPSDQWGSASSPIVWGGKVFVQCDTQEEDFLLALDANTGATLWRADRDELPSWGTPTIVTGAARNELVTNGSNFIRGYDPETGRELWRLGGSSQITAPTPIFANGLIVVASGRHPAKPIFVFRPGAEGDITLPQDQVASEYVVWSRRGRGPYMPTPIVYGDLLYVLSNQGLLDAYELATGEEIYRQRIRHGGGGFSGSPVATDGKLYLPSEDGHVYVVRAGRAFELIASNPLGERLMSSPALAQGLLLLRGEHTLVAVGNER